uniref:Uncharacterized protein n=2 Tax=Macaca TaxID=9539 RepID=A0A5F8AN93_MACMU
VAGIIGACHHTQQIFVFLVEKGFHHVGQVGLKLLTSGDPPASASQSAGITYVPTTPSYHVYFLRQISLPKMKAKNVLYPERDQTVPLLTLEMCLAKLFLIENTKFHVSLACPNYHTFQMGNQNE